MSTRQLRVSDYCRPDRIESAHRRCCGHVSFESDMVGRLLVDCGCACHNPAACSADPPRAKASERPGPERVEHGTGSALGAGSSACAPPVAPRGGVAGEASRDAQSPPTPASRLAQLSYVEATKARLAAIDACQEMHRIVQTDGSVWHSLDDLIALVTSDENVAAAIYERFNGLLSSSPLPREEIAAEYSDSDDLAGALYAITRCENGACDRLGVAAAPGSTLCEDCIAEAGQADPMDMEGDR